MRSGTYEDLVAGCQPASNTYNDSCRDAPSSVVAEDYPATGQAAEASSGVEIDGVGSKVVNEPCSCPRCFFNELEAEFSAMARAPWEDQESSDETAKPEVTRARTIRDAEYEAAAKVKAKFTKGACTRCGRLIRILGNGAVANHLDGLAVCPGSGRLPGGKP